ncbi:hypothetical protein H7H37_08010, partial [Mycolicibacterium insubricum]|nr:hypothetical protein [Mycolicibacterium insubricum]
MTPRALIDAADERGLALFDVPLPTPFVALVQAVVNESARQQSQSSTHARNVQQRMTRAAVSGGPGRDAAGAASGCAGIAVLADRHGRINPPILDPAVQALVFDQIRRNPGSSAVESVGPGAIVTQPIRVGHTGHGWLAVVFEHPPQPTDHILIGHANSLLALDFEKPLRLRTAQHRLNAAALGAAAGRRRRPGPGAAAGGRGSRQHRHPGVGAVRRHLGRAGRTPAPGAAGRGSSGLRAHRGHA